MARMQPLPEEVTPQERPLAKVIPIRPTRRLIVNSWLVPTRSLPARRFGPLQQWWSKTPTVVKRDAAALAVLAGTAELVATSFSPFFVFGLSLVVRLLFFLIYSLRVEIGRFEAKVAARTLAYINVVALVAITVVLVTSTAIWKYQAFLYLVFALVMEVIGMRTWYTQWAVNSENWNDGADGLNRVFEPKKWYLLAAFAFLITEYIAYGIEWCPLLDQIILFGWHAIVLLYHLFLAIIHIVVLIGRALQHL